MKTVQHIQLGRYVIHLGAYNPFNAYSRMLAAFCAHKAGEALFHFTVQDAEDWCRDHLPDAAEIIAAEHAGTLPTLIAPGSLPFNPMNAAVEVPIIQEILEHGES